MKPLDEANRVIEPYPGKLYAVYHSPNYGLSDTVPDFAIISEREYDTTWDGYPAKGRKVMGYVPVGGLIFYVGKMGQWHKVGYQDYFGLMKENDVWFFEPEEEEDENE